MEIPYNIYCCYAHEDEEQLRKLKKQLAPLQRAGLVTVRADIDISPGRELKQEIDHHLGEADIILLLISPDFVASDYCFDDEMMQAMARHEQGKARVVPIIIRSTYWRGLPFSDLHVLPKSGLPIMKWQNQDDAFLNVEEGIRIIVQELTSTKGAHPSSSNAWEPPVKGASSGYSGEQEYGTHPTHTENYHGNVINNSGSVSGNVIGSVVGDVIGRDSIKEQHIHMPGDQKDGMRSLDRGAKALWSGDYALAQNELRTAIDELEKKGQSREAAKACYFSALAFLGGMLPHTQRNQINQAVEARMLKARNLSPACASYYRISACLKKDVSEHIRALNNLKAEVHALESKGRSLSRSIDDEENEQYFRHCQPLLQL